MYTGHKFTYEFTFLFEKPSAILLWTPQRLHDRLIDVDKYLEIYYRYTSTQCHQIPCFYDAAFESYAKHMFHLSYGLC